MDTGQISVVILVGFWVIFGAVMFWTYGFTPILHWFIKANGEPAKAVILEMRKAGWGWYAGSRYSESLVFQPVAVKLEVHPTNGATYVVNDRFNAKSDDYRYNLKPGAEIQVSIARFNPRWVASWPETAVDTHAEQYDQPVRHAGSAGVPAAATALKNSLTNVVIVLGLLVAFLCVLLVAGGFYYSEYLSGRVLSAVNGRVATVMPAGASAPALPSGSGAAGLPVGGLTDLPTRGAAWGQALTAVLQANPTSCMSPDAGKTTIAVTRNPDFSGAWQERWTVACNGASPVPVDITFSPAGGGVFTEKAVVAH